MPRRTKQDALATRASILDAAELLFSRQGVSRTSLQQIADAAKVTRGAIYWHFEDKSAVFNAMLERVTMPLELALDSVDASGVSDPLAVLREWVLNAFTLIMNDATARRVVEIATHKVEYVDELNGVRDRHLASHKLWLTRTEAMLESADERGMLNTDLTPREIAQGLWAMVDGLIRAWLLEPEAFNLVYGGQRLAEAYLGGLAVAIKQE